MKIYNLGLLSVSLLAMGTAGLYWFRTASVNNAEVARLTDNWIDNVVLHNDPNKLYKMFGSDASLFGTVSRKYRMGDMIKEYFNYFAKLPNISVIEKRYHVHHIGNNIYLNNAFVTWQWDGLPAPLVARMSFLFKGDHLRHLHSSTLPVPPKELE